ncbi:MAG TPA: hypothetical protein DD490_34015 [Acidobacteria bacterium]|nr:hypothetical protein [Acidobacteriota bacterium]
MKNRGPVLFCLLAGGGDTATGVLLLAAPRFVLHLLGIPAPEGDPVLLRFVGVFVGCVGLCYLYPWLLGGRRRSHRLTAAIEMTAGVRLAVALFLAFAVMFSRLDLPWATVGAYDALVATAQVGLLLRGFFGDGT